MREAWQRAEVGRRDGRGGFALLEVMLALVLIGLLATLALPGLVRSTGPATLHIAAMEASALLRHDRDEARRTGSPTAVTVDDGRVRSLTTRAAVAMPYGAAVRLAGDVPSIRFFADGRSSGGDLLLASRSARFVIAVSPDTGAIVVSSP